MDKKISVKIVFFENHFHEALFLSYFQRIPIAVNALNSRNNSLVVGWGGRGEGFGES
jgi:hypothetical protein